MDTPPSPNEILFTIGPYQVLKEIEIGGMGEIFLGYDPSCNRKIAIKRMPKAAKKSKAHEDFLQEAHLTSQMNHPAIVPVYSLVDEEDATYYTMPYIEGITLRDLIEIGQDNIKAGIPLDPRASVPILLQAFLTICRAMAYAHSKGLIHRDLKPSNIMIREDGSAVVLDWGLIKQVSDAPSEPIDKPLDLCLVKVAGTVPYIAPEQTQGEQAGQLTEVYALGIILYEMLALRHPFHRDNIDEYRSNLASEVLLDPAKASPFRGITPILSMITLKCLAATQERYQSVNDLIADLENFLFKRSGWLEIAQWDLKQPSQWEAPKINPFKLDNQKIIVFKQSLAEFLKMTIKVKLHGEGIGFFLGMPPAERWSRIQNGGYFIWLTDDNKRQSKLIDLPQHEVAIPSVFLPQDMWVEIEIEKIENTINLLINQILQFTYVSQSPILEHHVGLYVADQATEVQEVKGFLEGHAFAPNPLASANALFSEQNFTKALEQYRSVRERQPFTSEGRKAGFRAGLALLAMKRLERDPDLELCEREFEKLSDIEARPLALLGKSLILRAQGQAIKEAENFEIAFERYSKHELIPAWENQLLSRILEGFHGDRKILTRFLLVAIRYLPEHLITSQIQQLLLQVKQSVGRLYFFFNEPAAYARSSTLRLDWVLRLAFLLAQPETIVQVIQERLLAPSPHLYTLVNALWALLELGAYELTERSVEQICGRFLDVQALAHFNWIKEALWIHKQTTIQFPQELLAEFPKELSNQNMRIIHYILKEALKRKQTNVVYKGIDQLEKKCKISEELQLFLRSFRIWALLLDRNLKEVKSLIDRHSTEEDPILFFLKGCWFATKEGEKAARRHFAATPDTPYLPFRFGQYIKQGEVWPENWLMQAFLWEKRMFFDQGSLYYYCLKNRELENKFIMLEKLCYKK